MTQLIPFGFTRYSIEYPDEINPSSDAPLPAQSIVVLGEVNRYWNDGISAIPEQEWLGMSGADMNHWHVFTSSGNRGVCHDYAVTKRHALSQYHGLAGNLALAWLHRDSDGARVDHLVLLVHTMDAVMVLDNLFRNPYPIEDARGYEWISRQEWNDPARWIPGI